MNNLTCIENYIDNEHQHYGSFCIEPLELGQGITLGNTLRRTLLSDLAGFSITGVRINNIKHEFASIEGLREDILELILNLKEVILKPSFGTKNQTTKLVGFLNAKGPKIITAGMFYLPKNKIKILNPNQYICTIIDDSEIYFEIDIEKGKGYRLSEENRQKNFDEKLFLLQPSTLSIDAVFMPVKKVNYKIKLINDSKGNIKESLNLSIWTNGSISPKRSIQDSLKTLINLLYPLMISRNFLTISSELAKKTYQLKK